MAGGDVDGDQRRRRAGPEWQLLQEADERERHAGRRMRVRRIEIPPAGRDPRRELEPRALALIGEGAKGDEIEIVLRRDRLQARVHHRLEPGFWQRVGVDRRA